MGPPGSPPATVALTQPKLQPMDLTSLKAVVAELAPALLPSRFEKAQQGRGHALQLGLRSLNGIHWLELSWQAEAPRLHAIAPPPRQGEGSTLAQQLQHGLRGLALIHLQQVGWERVVEFGFARRPGDPIERWLVLELMGRHSNVFLLDGQRRVVTLARQVRQQQSRWRPIGTGDLYQSPPPLQGEPPLLGESRASWQRRLQLQDLPLAEALLRSYQGISPALGRQLVDPLDDATLLSTLVGSLTEAQWLALHGRWQCWLRALEQQCFGYWQREDHYRCWGEEPGLGSVNEGLAQYYIQVLAIRDHGQLQHQWCQRLQQAIAREGEQLLQQQGLLAAVSQSETFQQEADGLLSQINPGREQIDRAQKLYKQARKLRRSGAAINLRIATHMQRLQWLEASVTYLEQADNLAALQSLVLDLEPEFLARSAGRSSGGPPPGRPGPSRRSSRRLPAEQGQPQPLELASPAGLRLQVGRNHRQNAWISLKLARRGDLWFHAQECPGSHVVLKASEGPADSFDLDAAADVAAYFSRARGNRRVPVVMVETDALQRIPGAALGTVRHQGGTVLWGEPHRAVALLNGVPSLAEAPLP